MGLYTLPARITKKYSRVVVLFIVIYSVGQMVVTNQSTVLFQLKNLKSRSFVASEFGDFGEFKQFLQHSLHLIEKDTIIYSEDEVQLQLKAIHKKGEELIGLKHDKCKKRLPECLIIGNYKCGTQELLEFMFMHPRIRIYREPHFELHFFSGIHHMDYEWYRKQMPCSYSGQITVEKTPGYFQDPRAPFRIAKMNPNMKLIVMVRDPIERALSDFSFSKDRNRYNYSFERCAFDRRGNVQRVCFAISNSIYDEGIRRYMQVFKRSQILVLNNNDFKNDPFAVLHHVESFLGIEHVIDKNYFAYVRQKGFYCVRSVLNKTLVACYDRRRGRKNGYQLSITNISSMNMKKLKEFFKPRNKRFFEAIGRTFNWQSNY